MNISASLISETSTYNDYADANQVNPYNGSPIQLFQEMSSKKKGAAFEKLISEILTSNGYKVEKASHTDHDRQINGYKIEIKGSLGWVTKGKITHYRFQQIRESQDYDYVLFAFFTPTDVILKVAKKSVAMRHLSYQDENGFYPHNQHGGKRVNSGTFCLDCNPGEIEWMEDVAVLSN